MAVRGQLAGVVHDLHAGACNVDPDGDAGPEVVDLVGKDRVSRAGHHRLGGPVLVDHGSLEYPRPCADGVSVKGVPAHDQPSHRPVETFALEQVGKQPDVMRRRLHEREVGSPPEDLGQLQHGIVLAHDREATADEQRPEQAREGRVETDRGEQRRPGTGGHAVGALCPVQVAVHGPAAHHDALRLARAARGVEHVGHALDVRRGLGRPDGLRHL